MDRRDDNDEWELELVGAGRRDPKAQDDGGHWGRDVRRWQPGTNATWPSRPQDAPNAPRHGEPPAPLHLHARGPAWSLEDASGDVLREFRDLGLALSASRAIADRMGLQLVVHRERAA